MRQKKKRDIAYCDMRYLKIIIMKITKKTKIKDLVPDGIALGGVEVTDHSTCIDFKSKEKTFGEYCVEYRNMHIDNVFHKYMVDVEHFPMRDKLGLLWYIIKENGGTLKDYSDLMFRIAQPNDDCLTVPEVAYKVWNMLPQSFVESFKSIYKNA